VDAGNHLDRNRRGRSPFRKPRTRCHGGAGARITARCHCQAEQHLLVESGRGSAPRSGRWIAETRGNSPDAIAHLRSAAELEESMDKHAVTPGPVTPAREMLAEVLFLQNHPQDALTEYQAVLKVAPTVSTRSMARRTPPKPPQHPSRRRILPQSHANRRRRRTPRIGDRPQENYGHRAEAAL